MIVLAVLFLAIVLLAAWFAIRSHYRTPATTATIASTGGNSTGNYTAGNVTSAPNGITSQWVGRQLDAWKPARIYPVLFSAVATGLSYSNPETSFNYNSSAISAELSMLYDTNISAVAIHLNYDPWLDNNTGEIATMGYFVNSIRSSGKKLIIVDAAAESYRNNKLPWPQFKAAWVRRVKVIAALYHPDYYEVVKEPPWYFPMIQGSPFVVPFNASDWANLTEQLAAAVKSVSPNTQVGVAVDSGLYTQQRGPLDLDYLKAVENISNVSFIGFDIYTANGFNQTQEFLDTVGRGYKQVWITEAWSGTVPYIFNSSRAQLDAGWIQALYYFALKNNVSTVIPFYTDFFSSYSQLPAPATPAQAESYYQGRTPVFYEYQKIIRSNRAGQVLNSSP